MKKKEDIYLPNHIIEWYGLKEKSPIEFRIECRRLYVYSKEDGKSIQFRLFKNNVIDVFFIYEGKAKEIKLSFDFSNKDDLKKLDEYISKCNEM